MNIFCIAFYYSPSNNHSFLFISIAWLQWMNTSKGKLILPKWQWTWYTTIPYLHIMIVGCFTYQSFKFVFSTIHSMPHVTTTMYNNERKILYLNNIIRYMKNQWTKHRVVCTHSDAFSMLISNMGIISNNFEFFENCLTRNRTCCTCTRYNTSVIMHTQ